MASHITKVKTAPREVRGANTGKSYTIQLTPAGVMIRERGKRTWFGPVSYDAVFSLAVKAEIGMGSMVRPKRKE